MDSTVYDVLVAARPDVRPIIQPTTTPGLDIVPANIDLSAAEVQLVNEVAREQALVRVLRPILDDYDAILVDCQPSLGLLTINALTASHGVIIPLETEFFALRRSPRSLPAAAGWMPRNFCASAMIRPS